MQMEARMSKAVQGNVKKPVSILLIDDDAGDRMVIQNILKACNSSIDLKVTEDGEEALSYLKRQGTYADAQRPHLVLLDLNLPKADGAEILAEIRVDPELTTLPVIVLTTSSAPNDIRRSYALHANAFISKSADLNQLRSAIEHLYAFWFGVAKLPG
jgi:two-component system, chemotaxis family, response regulator Rcp1